MTVIPHKKIKLSEILGCSDSLYGAIDRAVNLTRRGKFSREQIMDAVRLRYSNRLLRALTYRPVPEAPLLYVGSNGYVHGVQLQDLPALLETKWSALARTHDNNPSFCLEYLARQFKPLMGLCVPHMHLIMYDPTVRWRGERLVAPEQNANQEAVSDWINGAVVLDRSIPRAHDIARQHMTVCHTHAVASCPSCGAASEIHRLTLAELLSGLQEGCQPCRSREWLALKQPPKASPRQVSAWLRSAREFADVL